MNWGEKQLYVGFEYDYWKDKYGIGDEILQGTDQNTASNCDCRLAGISCNNLYRANLPSCGVIASRSGSSTL